MNTYQTKNRKKGFITVLAAAAAVALVCGGHAGATTTVNTIWIGPSGNSSQGGSWDTSANWQSSFSANSTNYTGHWIPGTNGTGSYDSSITPSGPSGGYSDSGYIMGEAGNSTGITVTMTGNYSADASYLNGLRLNSGFHYSTAPDPNSPVTLNIGPGANLPTGLSMGGDSIYGATVNVQGGTVTGGFDVGAGISAGSYGQSTSTLNVSSGSINMPSSQWGFSVGNGGSNGVLNVSGTGQVNVGYPGSIVLGASAPVTTAHQGTLIGSGTLNQTGGTINVNRGIFVGYDTVGTYNLSAGTATVGGIEVASYGQGTFSLSGTGVLNTTGGLSIAGLGEQGINAGASGNPTGLAVITGGTLNAVSLSSGNSVGSGTAELQVVGSAASLNFQAGAGSSAMRTFGNSLLDFQIGSSGVSTIVADGGGSTSTQNDTRDVVALSGTLELDLLNGFTPAKGAIYTLISTNVVTGTGAAYMGIVTTNTLLTNYNNQGNVQNTGLSLASADAADWQLLVNTLGSGLSETTVLQAQYIGPVPEPATLGLMAMGSLGILLLGRKRKPA